MEPEDAALVRFDLEVGSESHSQKDDPVPTRGPLAQILENSPYGSALFLVQWQVLTAFPFLSNPILLPLMLVARPRILAALLLIFTPLLLFALSWMGDLHRSQEVEPLIVEAANRHNLPISLLRAVVWRESNFEPRAVGTSGERGLMQVTSGAAQDWAEATRLRSFRNTDLFDPQTNLAAGSWYLSRAMKRWSQADRPEVFALAEYNAGITHARRWSRDNPTLNSEDFIRAIDFPTTKAYIRAILKRADLYASGQKPSPLESVKRNLVSQKERWLKK